MKIAVVQRFLPHYRVAFYRETVALLRQDGSELLLFYSRTIGSVPSEPWANRVFAFTKNVRLGEMTETVVFAPTLPINLLRFRPDVVVVEDISNLVGSLLAALYCRATRTPYLIWGLGRIPKKTPSRLRWLAKTWIDYLYRGSSGFIGYSQAAAQIYAEFGKPTYVATNASLPKPNTHAIAETLASLPPRYTTGLQRLVAIGEMKPQKRFDVLLRAFAAVQDENTILYIIGDGQCCGELRMLASELGISDKVVFCGAIYDARRKREIIRQSVLGIVPGRGGLVLQDLMSEGVPVICGPADGTELDHLVSGKNGILLEDAANAEDLAGAITAFLRLPVEQKLELSKQALATVANGYNISAMADGFVRAVASAHKDRHP
jgi:glycosyltransferase involved in cell wall biosynthesis